MGMGDWGKAVLPVDGTDRSRVDPDSVGTIKSNLQGIAIGNGLVDPTVQYQYYAQYAFDHKVVNSKEYGLMKAGLGVCLPLIEACAKNMSNFLACENAVAMCNIMELMPVEFTGRNLYDVRKNCTVPPLCYNFTAVTAYLNTPSVMAALGTTGHAWQDCNRVVDLKMTLSGDWMQHFQQDLPALLAAKKRVLVYSGEYDFVVRPSGGLTSWLQHCPFHLPLLGRSPVSCVH